MNGVPQYGRRKLDPKAYAEQEAKKTLSTREATVYGRRKGVGKPAAAPPAPDTSEFRAAGGTAGPISIAQLAVNLRERPQMLDAAIAHELRQSTPRKGALELFSQMERQKEKPRTDVLDKLAAALT